MNTAILGQETETILTPMDLAERLHIGRDKAYALIKSKGFPSVCIGKRYIVTSRALDEWLKSYEYKTYVI